VIALVQLKARRLERFVADPERQEQRLALVAPGAEQRADGQALGQHPDGRRPAVDRGRGGCIGRRGVAARHLDHLR
jgi:hypothetical protein